MPDEESMIQDLREIEKEFRDSGEYRKANIIDLFIKYSVHCKISRSKILETINNSTLSKQEQQIFKLLIGLVEE